MREPILAGIGTPYLFQLKPRLNRLGRNPTNDLRVADPTVSSFHCELELVDGVLAVRDLSSTNGTFVDGKQVVESSVAPGQMLRFGSVDFRVEDSSAAEVRVVIPDLAQPEAPLAPKTLEDGRPACTNHAQVEAVFNCGKCQHHFCPQCVRPLRLAGGKPRYFCVLCDGPCLRIPPPPIAAGLLKSFLGKLTGTMRIKK